MLNFLPAYGKNPGAPDAGQIRERVAASIYRQAEANLEFGDKDAAIAQLLRITQVTPDTEIAIKAQYDAGVYLMDQKAYLNDAGKLPSNANSGYTHGATSGVNQIFNRGGDDT